MFIGNGFSTCASNSPPLVSAPMTMRPWSHSTCHISAAAWAQRSEPCNLPKQGGGAIVVGFDKFSTASQCGAAVVPGARVSISNSMFEGNQAFDRGGAVLVEAGNVTFSVSSASCPGLACVAGTDSYGLKLIFCTCLHVRRR